MSEELQVRIQDLHDMLEGQPVDDCTAASLKQITTELQLALAQADGTIPQEAYNEELEKEALRFAEDHPAIAQAVRQIMNTLGNIGI
ncbi:DUF4404 family protein [Parendozoicomonas sp. Alg238-R29]|uniref:DUF4404 family protein n=1 Tax=Parendozoicomonas sp. Alg238-R29 TaxID=2993446 RepID=UPI00248F1426|nr:DUF4404 family protein [Parendozoicomonas sp. Alg238-R29]